MDSRHLIDSETACEDVFRMNNARCVPLSLLRGHGKDSHAQPQGSMVVVVMECEGGGDGRAEPREGGRARLRLVGKDRELDRCYFPSQPVHITPANMPTRDQTIPTENAADAEILPPFRSCIQSGSYRKHPVPGNTSPEPALAASGWVEGEGCSH
ncbi:unnamed protein product [Lota lota]